MTMFEPSEIIYQAPGEKHLLLNLFMNVPDKPTEPEEVELTEVDKKKKTKSSNNLSELSISRFVPT